jgi:adenylate cyclase
MRAAGWSTTRDIVAAHTSLHRALQIADRLPEDHPERTAMRIAPRTLLCAVAVRVGGSGAEIGFDELRDLCEAAGDKRSLAIGMTGLVAQQFTAHREEASDLASEHIRLLESIGDPTLTVGLSFAAMMAKGQGTGWAELLPLTERVIALSAGDPAMGALVFGSPLALAHAFRGHCRWALGRPGWADDFRQAIDMARAGDATTLALTVFYIYVGAIPWVLPADATTLRQSEETLAGAERSGDDLALNLAMCARAAVLLHKDDPDYDAGLALLEMARENVVRDRFSHAMTGHLDVETAWVRSQRGDLDGAIALLREAIANLYPSGESVSAVATGGFVDALLRRNGDGDIEEARAAIQRLATLDFGPDFVALELHLVRSRALLARAMGDDCRYREFRDRYREMATSLGYHGHIAAAEALT